MTDKEKFHCIHDAYGSVEIETEFGPHYAQFKAFNHFYNIDKNVFREHISVLKIEDNDENKILQRK